MKPSLIIRLEAEENPISSAILPLPAYPPQLYDAMDRARIPHDAAIRIKRVVRAEDHKPINWLPENPPFDKLNYLALTILHLLDDLFDYRYPRFLGLLQMEQDQLDMDGILNLSHNTGQADSIRCSSVTELGEITLQKKGVALKHISSEEAEEAGRERVKRESGVLLPEGYYVWKTGDVKQEYREEYLSGMPKANGIIDVYVTPKYSWPGRWLFLPVSDQEIKECYKAIGVKNDSDCISMRMAATIQAGQTA